jgi:hypothetical protein
MFIFLRVVKVSICLASFFSQWVMKYIVHLNTLEVCAKKLYRSDVNGYHQFEERNRSQYH